MEIFFRVNRVCKDSVVRVESGGASLANFKRDHLAPGEMERIVIPKTLLERASDNITVFIEEV